jgi:hypothetical protein
MAFIIGKSINLSGTHVVIDHVTVKEPRFNKELNEAIKSLYPNDTPEHKNLVEIITKTAQDGLKTFRSVHVAGKYFFSSKRNTKETLKHLKN